MAEPITDQDYHGAWIYPKGHPVCSSNSWLHDRYKSPDRFDKISSTLQFPHGNDSISRSPISSFDTSKINASTGEESALEVERQNTSSFSLDKDEEALQPVADDVISKNSYLLSYSESTYTSQQSQDGHDDDDKFSSRSLNQYNVRTNSRNMSLPLDSSGSFHITSITSSSSQYVKDSIEDATTKKAEQNRAAQRAFRQRKQQYIKWLESKAEELNETCRVLALVRSENEQLRKVVLDLDRKIRGESQGEGNLTARSSISESVLSKDASTNFMNIGTIPYLNGAIGKKFSSVKKPNYNPRSSSETKRSHIIGNAPFNPNLRHRSLPNIGLTNRNSSQWPLNQNTASFSNGFMTTPGKEMPIILPPPPIRHISPTMQFDIHSSAQSLHPFAVIDAAVPSSGDISGDSHYTNVHSLQPRELSQSIESVSYVQQQQQQQQCPFSVSAVPGDHESPLNLNRPCDLLSVQEPSQNLNRDGMTTSQLGYSIPQYQ